MDITEVAPDKKIAVSKVELLYDIIRWLLMDTCRNNATGRLLRRASQLGDTYAVVPKLSFANAVRVSFFEDKVGLRGTLDDDWLTHWHVSA